MTEFHINSTVIGHWRNKNTVQAQRHHESGENMLILLIYFSIETVHALQAQSSVIFWVWNTHFLSIEKISDIRSSFLHDFLRFLAWMAVKLHIGPNSSNFA